MPHALQKCWQFVCHTSGAFGAGKLTSARAMCAVRAGLHLAGSAAGNLRKGHKRMLFPSEGEKKKSGQHTSNQRIPAHLCPLKAVNAAPGSDVLH